MLCRLSTDRHPGNFGGNFMNKGTTSPKAWRDSQNQPWISLKYQQKHFPAADRWMWNYCEFLGSFTHDDKHYDLGLYLDAEYCGHISYAIVYGNIPGEYISGPITLQCKDAVQAETVRRGLLMGFIKPI